MPESIQDLINILACPECFQKLDISGEVLLCSSCNEKYRVEENIYLLIPRKKDKIFDRYRECIEKLAKDDIREPFEKNKEEERYIPLLKFIGDTANKIILEVGSAQGIFLKKLKGRKIALDLSLNFLNVAQKEGLFAVAGDAAYLPFLDSSIDIVICSDVLEHVLFPEKVVSQIYRVLKSDGKLFLVVPWKENLNQYKIYEGVYEFTHLRTFDRYSIKNLLQDFELIRRQGIIPKPPSFPSDSFIHRMIYRIYYRLPLNIKIKLFGPVHMMIEAIPKRNAILG